MFCPGVADAGNDMPAKARSAAFMTAFSTRLVVPKVTLKIGYLPIFTPFVVVKLPLTLLKLITV